MTDPISDFLTRIRNAASAGQQEVFVPFSKMKAELSRILQEEGYIWSYEVDTKETHPRLKLKLKYQGKSPVIRSLTRISKPGLRKYVGSTEIPRVLGGLGISILSTSRGIMTGARAKKAKVGGELLAQIW
ncbi:MAG: 30S ribosomal protein S8 [Verrucomicrobiota bacterium]|jgi:small subunit ribosomal protein S8|uniref:Small ribosomal subunit protein uS8 n=2 Tax=Prosthecobacter TaxID=48463 RepID=A0A7W8DS19_9BACT|nr:30S ribosomal protein S8 [Prosthecobacter dejongeii]MBB5040022.1 small subunit ribosomal protein S8 [Prosthecobacter dejongeii]